jgi:hypothetical protein
MNQQKHRKLMLAIEKFIDGRDSSLQAANEIEGLLAELFAEDDRFEDTVLALASYRPGGGDYLYDEQQMKRVLVQTMGLLKSMDLP